MVLSCTPYLAAVTAILSFPRIDLMVWMSWFGIFEVRYKGATPLPRNLAPSA
jgi:hypothetical protein